MMTALDSPSSGLRRQDMVRTDNTRESDRTGSNASADSTSSRGIRKHRSSGSLHRRPSLDQPLDGPAGVHHPSPVASTSDMTSRPIHAPQPEGTHSYFDLAPRKQRLPRRPHTSGGITRSPSPTTPIVPVPRRQPADRFTSPPATPSSSRTPTPTGSAPSSYATPMPTPQILHPPNAPITQRPMPSPSLQRARSMSDLLSPPESLKGKEREDTIHPNARFGRSDSLRTSPSGSPSDTAVQKETQLNSSSWTTVDDLVDKMLFLVISGDDPAFVRHFFLIYRRFACPRSILLAMQRRMRSLDTKAAYNPIFWTFSQQRICGALLQWTRMYPGDFAVPGVEGALDALIKSIIRKTHLLSFAQPFHDFRQCLPVLKDPDAAWAKKPDAAIPDESDDSYSLSDDDDAPEQPSSSSSLDVVGAGDDLHLKRASSNGSRPSSEIRRATRMRKASLPFGGLEPPEMSPWELRKAKLRQLSELAHDLDLFHSEEIAQEITRIGTDMFLAIHPRHWLHYTFLGSKQSTESGTVTRFNQFSNKLAEWVVSLILCHDKPRNRARQIEKFVEIAAVLRSTNNYSGLRAIVSGINAAAYPEDPTMEAFKKHAPERAKQLRSWILLLQQMGGHKAYRLALRNTSGACIPALEVHQSDLLRAQEGNKDSHEKYPRRIHWAKFNMMSKFIDTVVDCQVKCRRVDYGRYPPRPAIAQLLVSDALMDDQMQQSRMDSSDEQGDISTPIVRPLSRLEGNTPRRDSVIWRKLKLFPR